MKGLSRMRGNSHVRFLGEGLAVMPSSYPIRESAKDVLVMKANCFDCTEGVPHDVAFL